MEHISEILKRQTRTYTSGENTDTWSSDEEKHPEVLGDKNCPVCQGSGFLYPRLPSGKPDYSRVIPCRCTQNKSKESRYATLIHYSNLGSLSRFTFTTISPQGQSDDPLIQAQFHKAYEAAKTFAEKPKGWLVLIGPSGSGKTRLAAAIANYCLEKNQPVFV